MILSRRRSVGGRMRWACLSQLLAHYCVLLNAADLHPSIRADAVGAECNERFNKTYAKHQDQPADPGLKAAVLALHVRVAGWYQDLGLPKPEVRSSRHGGGAVWLPGYFTGGGAMPYDLELLVQLSRGKFGQALSIVGIGNAFGYSTLAIAAVFPHARVDVMDAEVEGSHNHNGSEWTRRIAAAQGLRVHVHKGLSPADVPIIFKRNGQLPIDIAFIDGLHTNQQQLADWTALRPHLHPEHHVVILHDVHLARMQASLAKIKQGYAGYVREYDAVNVCNRFGTHLATLEHRDPFG